MAYCHSSLARVSDSGLQRVPDPAGLDEEARVKELARFLLQNAQLDFSGDVTMDQVRQYLRDDDSREARALLANLSEDKGIEDMLVTVADCLKEHIPTGVTEDVIRGQLAMYTES